MHHPREGHRGWLRLACLALCSWTASSRFLRQSIKVGLHGKKKANKYDHRRWHYVAKFAFGQEGGEVAMRARLKSGLENYQDYQWNRITTLQIDFNAYNEKKWLTAGKLMRQSEKNVQHQALKMCSLSGSPYHIKPRATRVVEFPFEMSKTNDNWGDWVEVKFSPEHRSHMWYFTISDCENKLSKSEIEFELKMTQADGTEFSVEREFSLPAHYISLAVVLLFMMYWGYRLYLQEGGWDGVWQLHPLMYCLTAIMAFQFLGHFFHLDHLSGFQVNGVGNETIDIAAEAFMALAQVMQVLVLIMLAMGYAIVDADPPDTNIMVPIVLLIVGLHTFAVMASHMSGTEHAHRFHGHEGLYGYFMVFMRLSLFVWFIFASEGTKQRANHKVKLFLRKLQFAGCFYFLTYPIMWSVIKFFAAYLQHRVMQMSLLSMHFLMNVILAHLFLAGGDHFRLKNGWYFEGSFWDDDPVPVTDMGSSKVSPEETARMRNLGAEKKSTLGMEELQALVKMTEILEEEVDKMEGKGVTELAKEPPAPPEPPPPDLEATNFGKAS